MVIVVRNQIIFVMVVEMAGKSECRIYCEIYNYRQKFNAPSIKAEGVERACLTRERRGVRR